MHFRPAHQLHQALAVLAPPKRFALLMLVLSGVERSVSQLASAVRLSQSCTSRHLQALERAGLVKGVRDGKRVVFRAAPRDAVAAGVLASLTGARGGGRPAGSRAAPAGSRAASAPAIRRGKRPARSTGRKPPAPRPPAAAVQPSQAPRPAPPIAAPEAPTPQPIPESGKNPAPTSPVRPVWQELEDYLL